MGAPASTAPPALSPEDQALYDKACHTKTASELKNDAALDNAGIAALMNTVFKHKSDVKTAAESAVPGLFWVHYKIAADPVAVPEGINLSIKVFDSSEEAKNDFKANLGMTTAPLSKIAKVSDKPLGQVSLQFADRLAWVRDTLVIDLQTNEMDLLMGQAAALAKGQSLTTPPTDTPKASSPPKASNPAPLAVPAYLQTFASALDKYLADHAVPAAKQRKPDTKLATPVPIKAAVGTEFVIKLAKTENTHVLKPAIATGFVVPTGNGTANGYPFRALAPGKANVTLVVAHAQNLAIGTVAVVVEVTGKAGDDPHKDDFAQFHNKPVPWA